MDHPEFKPGFRFSMIDGLVIVVGAIAAAVLWSRMWWIGFIIAFVTGHFFLFCNVFRIARPLELTWAGIFVVLTCCTVLVGMPGWLGTIVMSLIFAAALIHVEMRKPSYHGVLWQWVNPKLSEWWEENKGELG